MTVKIGLLYSHGARLPGSHRPICRALFTHSHHAHIRGNPFSFFHQEKNRNKPEQSCVLTFQTQPQIIIQSERWQTCWNHYAPGCQPRRRTNRWQQTDRQTDRLHLHPHGGQLETRNSRRNCITLKKVNQLRNNNQSQKVLLSNDRRKAWHQ